MTEMSSWITIHGTVENFLKNVFSPYCLVGVVVIFLWLKTFSSIAKRYLWVNVFLFDFL